MASGNAFRVLRQSVLAVFALALLAGTWLGQRRVTSWEETLWVGIYPAMAGQDAASQDYVRGLRSEDFDAVARFMATEGHRYGVELAQPLRIDLGGPVGLPPEPPANQNPLAIMGWSLYLRWWAQRELADRPGPSPDIRLFAVFHDPIEGMALPHSLGLKKGRIGIAHLFANRRMAGSNNVVIAHELLHTLGATDKYDPDSDQPLYPEGFADPDRKPRYPQAYAEIMAGRIPVTPDQAEIPASLAQVRVGPATAAELRWPGS